MASKTCVLEPDVPVGRRKDATASSRPELVTPIEIEVYRLPMDDHAGIVLMYPGSASLTLARASRSERAEASFHERQFTFEESVTRLEASRRDQGGGDGDTWYEYCPRAFPAWIT